MDKKLLHCLIEQMPDVWGGGTNTVAWGGGVLGPPQSVKVIFISNKKTVDYSCFKSTSKTYT